MKNWIVGVFILALIVFGIVYLNYSSNDSKQDVAGETTENYFSDDAKVMYFYQDNCSWCIKQKEVLSKLGSEGYRVKSMNIGSNYPDNQKYWQEYDVSGTPTFIAENKDKISGYQNYDTLKAFLELHK